MLRLVRRHRYVAEKNKCRVWAGSHLNQPCDGSLLRKPEAAAAATAHRRDVNPNRGEPHRVALTFLVICPSGRAALRILTIRGREN